MRPPGLCRAPAPASLGAAALCAALAASANAEDAPARLTATEDVPRLASGALSIMGLSMVPSETASTLLLDSSSGEGFDFSAGQFGGAFTVSADLPLYLEGFLGWSRYDPVFIFSNGVEDARVPAKWNTIAATGGIGWDFPLRDGLVLRPIVNVALGHMESDLSVAGRVLERLGGADLDFLDRGRLTALGLGASVMLDFERRTEAYELDSELRWTHVHLEPAFGSSPIAAGADAMTLGMWNRLRVPTGFTVLRRPLRGVAELSGSLLPGDQGDALRTGWLVQWGLGLEIDFSDSAMPLISRGRIVARHVFGAHLHGASIGIAASF